ncbi:MAG: exodeoxyribonuclease VII small subunit [Desulfobulbales bacterium]
MKKKSFEEALAKLEQITKELEEGNLPLEESLKYFDEGVKLAEFCNSKLNDAQKKVEILLKKNDGFEPAPFKGLDGEEEE